MKFIADEMNAAGLSVLFLRAPSGEQFGFLTINNYGDLLAVRGGRHSLLREDGRSIPLDTTDPDCLAKARAA